MQHHPFFLFAGSLLLSIMLVFTPASSVYAADTDAEIIKHDAKAAVDSTSVYNSLTHGKVKNGYYIYKISAEDINHRGAYKAIQSAFDEAQKKARKSRPYKVVVEPGSYTLTKKLSIYSNTYFYLEGVTFIQAAGTSANMIKVGSSNDKRTGYYYKNITIDGGSSGGTLDENNNSNTLLKVAHASNFTIKNMKLKNTVDSHIVEVAGVNGFNVINCTFKNQTLVNTYYHEAIQLDRLIKGHFSGYVYEDLALKNIVIDNCTFSNVPRGVGAHTSILNNYINGVKITNNKFTNCSSAAIQMLSCINCTVSGNTITKCPRGIVIYQIRNRGDGTYLSSTIKKDGGIASTTPTTYISPPVNQNIVITNNNISLHGSDKYEASYDLAGIYIGGFHFSYDQKPSNGQTIPAGYYYMSGVTISDNKISTENMGVYLLYTKNASISNNQISFTGKKKNGYGILLRFSEAINTIKNNTIAKCTGNGVAVELYSSANNISGNTISSSSDSAIRINCSSVNSITKNTIKKGAADGIDISSSTVTDISKNKISSCAASGISSSSSTSDTIRSNTVTNCKAHGIEQYSGVITKISKNKIKGSGNYGIAVYGNANLANLVSNTVNSCNSSGIYVTDISNDLNIRSNTVKGCKTAQIFLQPSNTNHKITVASNKLTGTSSTLGLFAASGALNVQSNTITSCKIPVQLKSSVVAVIRQNTYTKNKTNTTRILNKDGSHKSYKTPSKPNGLIATSKNSSCVELSWQPSSNAQGYYIYRSTTKNGTYKLVGAVNGAENVTYVNGNLTAGSTYYYKVLSYRVSKNKHVVLQSVSSNIVSKSL